MQAAKFQVRSEGPVRITKATINAAWRRREAKQRLILRDQDCRGLALVVNPTGMTWSYNYRPRGLDPVTGRRASNRSITIGNPASHTPDEARLAVNRVKGAAASGTGPADERRAKREAARWQRAQTVARLLEQYAQALPRRSKLRGTGLPSPKHVAEELAQLRAGVVEMDAAERPIATINAADLRRMTAALADRPATARARFGALSRFFDWCQGEDHIEGNPCVMLARSRRPKAVPARLHFLTVPELARLWHAAEVLAPVYRDLVHLLIAVPCRRGEASRLDWSQLDLTRGLWTLPGMMTKNGDPHRLHLPQLVLTILQGRHAVAGKPRCGLVFPAPQSAQPIDTFSVLKADLDGAAGITGWRWHDFRRSFASALGEAGIAEPVADAVLNHRQSATRGGVTGIYQRAQPWPEQVKAMQVWNDMLSARVHPRSPEKTAATVVTLRPHTAWGASGRRPWGTGGQVRSVSR